MSNKTYKQRKVRAKTAEFSVEDLPVKTVRPKRGRENESRKAVLFCAEESGNWCKLFTYSYAGSKNIPKNAWQNCSARKRGMAKQAAILGISIEVRYFNDFANSAISVYARALKHTNNRVSS